MELWKSILKILSEESVYAPILALIGASLITLKESEEETKPSILLLVFFIGLMLSLTLVPVIADSIESYYKSLSKLRPFEYFAMGYFGDSIFDLAQGFTKFLLTRETRKKIFNGILNWLIKQLTDFKSDKKDE